MFVLGSVVVLVKGGGTTVSSGFYESRQLGSVRWDSGGELSLSPTSKGCGDGGTERRNSEPRAPASNLMA